MKNTNIGILAVVIAAIVIVAAYFAITTYALPAVKTGDTVSVYYTGSFTNGTVFNSNVGGQLFNFTVGAGEVIPGFDQAVLGMHAGQNKTVTIPPQDAYGNVNQSLIVSLPIKDFGNQTVKVGSVFTNSAGSGSGVQGTVVAVNSTNATLDFNPPLAGKTLVFSIKIVKIKAG